MSEDISYVIQPCKYNTLCRHMSSLGSKEQYLSWSVSIIKIISQLRLANLNKINLYFNGCTYSFDSSNICTLCKLCYIFFFLVRFLKLSDNIRMFDNFILTNVCDSDDYINLVTIKCNQIMKSNKCSIGLC